MYLKGTVLQRETGRDLHLLVHFLNDCDNQNWLKLLSSLLCECQGTSTWVVSSAAFPDICISRELDWKWRNWDMTQYSYGMPTVFSGSLIHCDKPPASTFQTFESKGKISYILQSFIKREIHFLHIFINEILNILTKYNFL